VCEQLAAMGRDRGPPVLKAAPVRLPPRCVIDGQVFRERLTGFANECQILFHLGAAGTGPTGGKGPAGSPPFLIPGCLRSCHARTR
jgi:hypothetical protein